MNNNPSRTGMAIFGFSFWAGTTWRRQGRRR